MTTTYTEWNAPTYDDYCEIVYGSASVEPDHTCPTCGEEWFYEGFFWNSDNMTRYEGYPVIGDLCPACAIRNATIDQLHKAVTAAGCQSQVLSSILHCGRIPATDAAVDALDAIRGYMPDAFEDACREVLEDGLREYLLEVIRDEA